MEYNEFFSFFCDYVLQKQPPTLLFLETTFTPTICFKSDCYKVFIISPIKNSNIHEDLWSFILN